jgi:hypothetical protein
MDKEIDDGLTDEERAALEEDLDEGDEDETSIDDGADSDADAGDDADAGETVAAAADDTVQAAADAAEPAAATRSPILVVDAPADADAKLKDIATAKDALISQFDDGDITAKEYQQQLDALAKQEREIERAVERSALAAEMEQQRLKNEWAATVNAFIEINDVYNPTTNPRMYRALDQEVRDVAGSPEAKTMTGAQILAKAHENLAQAFGFEAKKEAPAGKVRRVPKPDLPPSLDKVPAAETLDVTSGKYGALDRLASTNPLAYEEALMKMSDRERDEYLASV